MTPPSASARWRQLCHRMGNFSDARTQAWFERLHAAYDEPQRHYHNFTHIADCLRHFDSAATLAHLPQAVEFALWFHDAVYDPQSLTNEEDSAQLACDCLRSLGELEALEPHVHALILATKHHLAPPATDAALLLDIDLAIIGQPPDAFDRYEAQIREEYAWVPDTTFAKKRAELLHQFLARPRLYTTDHFFERFEPSARANLTRSLQKLEALS